MNGKRWPAGTGDIAVELAPYEARILMFGGAPRASVQPPANRSIRPLTGTWRMAIPGKTERVFTTPGSWTDDPELRFFSGTATYRLRFEAAPAPGKCIALDFGEGVARPATPDARPARPLAAIDAPIRDAAIVRLNGQQVGALFAPPYRLDITRALRKGENLLEIDISNTALNQLAGRAPANFRLLSARYGERFQNKDQNKIVPAPSGLLGPVGLVEATASERPCGS
jgi:hypothetical protein